MLISLLILASCTRNSGTTASNPGTPAAPQSFSGSISNISLSEAGSELTIDGSGLNEASTAQLIDADGTVIDTLQIIVKTAEMLLLKPSKNLELNEGDITLRIL